MSFELCRVGKRMEETEEVGSDKEVKESVNNEGKAEK